MSTNEIIVLQEIKTTPASIEFDFDGAKARLEARLEPFKTVVTEDTIAQAKKEKAEINKLRKSIDDARKIETAKATVTVRAFQEKMEDLVKMCEEGYSHLNDQINKFESVIKDRLLGFLKDELMDQWEGLRVEKEFQVSTVDHLALLSNCNDAGMPNKKTKEAVKQLAMNDLAMQNKVDMRLIQLENEGLKAGVKGLSRVHVDGFLFADDETYKQRLQLLIEQEVKREEESKARFIEENKPIVIQQQAEPEPKISNEEYSQEYETFPVSEEKAIYLLTAVFEVSVDPSIKPEDISNSAISQMKKAGFNNLKSINVIRAD